MIALFPKTCSKGPVSANKTEHRFWPLNNFKMFGLISCKTSQLLKYWPKTRSNDRISPNISEHFRTFPVFVRSGGSIPVVNTFQNVLGIPAVLMGFGLPDDHIHGPNEKFHLPVFYKAIETSIWYLALASRLPTSTRTSQQKEWRA